jgi:hypothetical protein
MVANIAGDPKLFTYLEHCRAPYHIIIGDGRQSLTLAPNNSYALIAFDAFSSDSIPIHLITREAVSMYLSKLQNGGLLVFHISNRNLDLRPTLREIARDAHLACLVKAGGQSANYPSDNKAISTWCVMARCDSDLSPLLDQATGFNPPPSTPTASLWTDDFSNLVQTIRLL